MNTLVILFAVTRSPAGCLMLEFQNSLRTMGTPGSEVLCPQGHTSSQFRGVWYLLPLYSFPLQLWTDKLSWKMMLYKGNKQLKANASLPLDLPNL